MGSKKHSVCTNCGYCENSEGYFEGLLDDLYKLVLLEDEGIKLSEEQNEEYVRIYDILIQNDIEIPFGVVI